MRRRVTSAGWPIQRHSLLQLVADGVLITLSYVLAFELRFAGDFTHKLHRFDVLMTHTIWWVVPLVLVVLSCFGVYERMCTYVGQRDFEAIFKGVVLATLLIVGVIALAHPVYVDRASVMLPLGVIALFFL